MFGNRNLWLILAIASICFILDSTHGVPRILDPSAKGPLAPFIRGLEKKLDVFGIDVVLDKAHAFPASHRPRLAPLQGFRPIKTDWGGLTGNHWSFGFAKGLVGVVFAYKAPSLE